MSKKKDLLSELLPIARKVSYKTIHDSKKKVGKFVVAAGKSDTGKTYLIASMNDPIIIVDMDDGTAAIGKQYDENLQEEYDGLFPNKDIRIISIDMEEELDTKKNKLKNKEVEFSTTLVNALYKLRKTLAMLEEALKNNADIKSIAFETASWLWMAAMDYMKYKVLQLDETNKQYVESGFDWAIAQKQYRQVFMGFKKLRKYGCDVLITVHTKNTYNSKMEITGEEIHWWGQSIKMCDTIIWIKEKKTRDAKKKSITKRISSFHRLRDVKNAKKISKPIEDITWDKMLKELSRIRIKSKAIDKEEKEKQLSQSKYSTNEKVESKDNDKKRRRRIINEN